MKMSFTLIEMMLVVAIIAILAGITIASVTYLNRSAAVNKTKATMAKLAIALENYKADFGAYPGTELTTLNRTLASSNYNGQLVWDLTSGPKQYIEFAADETNLVVLAAGTITNILVFDGFGTPLGYDPITAMSTARRGAYPNGRVNFTSYDLWSFGPDLRSDADTNVVDDIKNWD
ncbi:MAG: prepilin-type N-terminal cleavage/methylation domain-containing protein [Verrucomicrobiae bacterium]|nr:prepilin-type N-terminal cleavage/methylation domain-containing protein [Verrucomicrobiae bacterium]